MSAERYWEGRWREKAENERLKVLNADAGNRGHGWRYSASATPTVKRYLSPLALSQEHAVRGLLAKVGCRGCTLHRWRSGRRRASAGAADPPGFRWVSRVARRWMSLLA